MSRSGGSGDPAAAAEAGAEDARQRALRAESSV